MTKGLKKPNPKDQKVEAEKKAKITKKVKSDKPVVKKASVAKGLPKPKRTSPERNYFTVAEDSQILEAVGAGGIVSAISKKLSVPLNRSVEAIRDRVKRYLNKITTAEKTQIHQQAKRNPKFFVHFKKENNVKKIEKIVATQPSLQLRELVRRPRVSKKVKKVNLKKVISPDEKFKWVAEKLQNKDSYFKLEFSVQLLADIFSVLINSEGISANDIQSYVSGVHCDQSLSSVLDHFKLKDN